MILSRNCWVCIDLVRLKLAQKKNVLVLGTARRPNSFIAKGWMFDRTHRLLDIMWLSNGYNASDEIATEIAASIDRLIDTKHLLYSSDYFPFICYSCKLWRCTNFDGCTHQLRVKLLENKWTMVYTYICLAGWKIYNERNNKIENVRQQSCLIDRMRAQVRSKSPSWNHTVCVFCLVHCAAG